MTQIPTPPEPVPPKPPTPKKELGDLGAPQVIFDTVAGPNLRLHDNLFQLICCVVLGLIGAAVALGFERSAVSLVMGGLCGFVAGGLLSGAFLGVYRFVTGVKRTANRPPK